MHGIYKIINLLYDLFAALSEHKRRKSHRIVTTLFTPAYSLLLSVRRRRLRYLGHLLRLPHDSVVRRTLIAMADGGNRYPEGSLFMDCQGSQLKDLETLAVNRTAWRSKVATLVV